MQLPEYFWIHCSKDFLVYCSKDFLVYCSKDFLVYCSKDFLVNCSKDFLVNCSKDFLVNCSKDFLVNCSKDFLVYCIYLKIFVHFAGVGPRTAEWLPFGQSWGAFLKSALEFKRHPRSAPRVSAKHAWKGAQQFLSISHDRTHLGQHVQDGGFQVHRRLG